MDKYQQRFLDIVHTRDYYHSKAGVDWKVILDNENKETILRFEESQDKHDLINNLLFIPWPLFIEGHIIFTTLGYAIAYNSIKNEVMDLFSNAVLNSPMIYKVIIDGFSFGSAMAKIAARHYGYMRKKKRSLPIISEIITYGDVKCFFNPFFKLKKLATKIYLFSCRNDWITYCVPICFRGKKADRVEQLSIKELIHPVHAHTYYEDYDYSNYIS